MRKKHRALFVFGAYLIVAGLVGYLSNPEKAATALLSGGAFGVLSMLCGLLLKRGQTWATWMGFGLCSFLALVFTWRATVGWMAYAGGQSEKFFAAALISSMLVGALLTLKTLWPERS